MNNKTFFAALILSVSSIIAFARAYESSTATDTTTNTKKVNYHLVTLENQIKVAKIGNESSKFVLTVPNAGANKISVTIFNEEGDLLLQEIREAIGDFAIEYNLVKSGSYTFIVSDKKGNSHIVQY